MIERFLSLLLVALLSAGAWANPCATGGRPFPVDGGSGMGGTGLKPGEIDGSGIGGTGHRDGSGAGGTGQQARTGGDGSGTGGTGVVGEITGFGSICVNGLEIHYDAQTPVSVDGQSGRADQLAVGQVVAVHAEGGGKALHARQIQVRHALVGRVDAVTPNGQLRVLGQWVSPPMMSRVKSGDRIKVSGYRADSRHVVASRIDPAQTGEADLLSGEVEWVEKGVAMVSGVRVRLPDGAGSPRAGEEVRVSGRSEAGGMRAERIGPDGVKGFLDRVERLSVKDRVRPASQPGKLRVGGMEFGPDAKAQVHGGKAGELKPGQLVRVEARRKDGKVVIERIEVREENGKREHEKSGQESTQSGHGAADAKEAESRGEREKHEERGAEEERRETSEIRAEGAEKIESEALAERSEKIEKEEKAERAEKSERAENPEKLERTDKPERAEKPETLERAEKPEKLERAEKPEKVEKPEKLERPEKPEKVEKPEKPERIEKPEKIERPERPEREDD